MKALRIDEHGDVTEVDLPDDAGGGFIGAVRALVAAQSVQAVDITSRWDLWLDEVGITNGRPINPYATRLAHRYGISATLRGTVIVTGAHREFGTAATLTPEQLATIRARTIAKPD
ncbi:DUF3846 domain-containing protein [Nonomuraea diastatica]|uniref:DUF3846 domain-containing protein n=1 Tax=Nonomuraea diastatica TaxID=1848329 RepID=A0A4R4VLS0_9ACTN|nr:DUF3846 domain-containing protein [Nonomuraea diastatica]TDD06738.1 DUF3846 domain-containing protein [Nonomuraea diastatica]